MQDIRGTKSSLEDGTEWQYDSLKDEVEGFKIPAGVKGRIYLPESLFYKVSDGNVLAVNFDTYIEPWSMTDINRQNCSIYLENKMEYDGGAQIGDTIVFSDMLWVNETASDAAGLGYNAECIVTDYSDKETGDFQFVSEKDGWSSYAYPTIDAPLNDSFDAIRFDLDYSQITGDRYLRLAYTFDRVVDEVKTHHSYKIKDYIICVYEDGSIKQCAISNSWSYTVAIPSGFKGTIIVPFSNIVNTDGMLFEQDVIDAKFSFEFSAPKGQTASVDNIGFLTTYKATDLVSARAQLMEEVFEETEKTVDLNGNGVLDAADIVYLKKIVAWAA